MGKKVDENKLVLDSVHISFNSDYNSVSMSDGKRSRVNMWVQFTKEEKTQLTAITMQAVARKLGSIPKMVSDSMTTVETAKPWYKRLFHL